MKRIRMAALLPTLMLAAFTMLPVKKVAHFSIESPFCSGCVAGIEAVAGELEGVEAVAVDVENHAILVTFDAEKTTAEALLASLRDNLAFKLSLKEVKEATDV